ncbi:MAG: indolepyruvate ferredoxin oxidoreductase family protein [Actinomycetota bacterium]
MVSVEAPSVQPDPGASSAGGHHLSGVQAVVATLFDVLRADRAAGRRTAAFVSGYQGSPLAGFDLELQRALRSDADVEVVHQPAVNEELAATAVMGSQLTATMTSARYDGVVGVWYGKAPGLDRAADALRHANWAGASRLGGAMALVGDDPAAKSSTLPSASERILADLGMPVLFPRNLAEIVELGRHAVALSRYSGAWVACKLVTTVADAQGTVSIAPAPPPVLPGGWEPPPVSGDLLTPTTIARQREVEGRRLTAAARYSDANELNRLVVDPARASLTLVAAGTVYTELVEALMLLGLGEEQLGNLGVRLAQIRMPFPLGSRFLRSVAAGTEEIIVVEERRDLVEGQILAGLARQRNGPAIIGRHDTDGVPFVPATETLDRRLLARLLQPVLASRFGDAVRPAPRERISIPVTAAAQRVPWFCSGCPHSVSTQVPPGTLVGAGIGCHSIVSFMPQERVGQIVGITQMGGEGAQWIGLAPFIDDNHLVQNLGDGTFFHSGQLAVRAAVAAGVPITFKILWNGASAMTGGQAVAGAAGTPLALAEMLVLEGVEKVVITTDDLTRYRRRPRRRASGRIEVRHREDILTVQGDLARLGGVTVLIHDQACATELRRARKRGLVARPKHAVVINERVCEGCGDCQTKSNCLSLQTVDTPLGPKTRIDAATCNVDLSCLAGDCPAFALVKVSPESKAEIVLPPDADALPTPPPAAYPVTIRVAGVGGTGVVTLAHLLARAAMLDGLGVWGLDQTGLSQKAGAVVSDLRFGPDADLRSNVLGDGEVDVLLAADLMATARPSVLVATDPTRTALVASVSSTLSGPMILGQSDRRIPLGELRDAVAGTCRSGGNFIDADAVARQAAGTAAVANVVLLGVAAQRGLLPVTIESLETAIRQNGVAVEQNLAAFRAGRSWTTGTGLRAQGDGSTGATDTGADPAALADDLEHYQSGRLATRFLQFVDETRAAEARAGGDGSLTAAVASGYYKLLAYKDEYEVARLLLDHPAADGKITWLLHPPVLRSLGLRRKVHLGPWATPLLKALRACRWLRGTPLDPFGHTKLRRLERHLPAEYAGAIRALFRQLDSTTLPSAVDIARLPDMVRGYEHVKLNAIASYRRELTARVSDYEQNAAPIQR